LKRPDGYAEPGLWLGSADTLAVTRWPLMGIIGIQPGRRCRQPGRASSRGKLCIVEVGDRHERTMDIKGTIERGYRSVRDAFATNFSSRGDVGAPFASTRWDPNLGMCGVRVAEAKPGWKWTRTR
jgi:hypothetical protein